MSPSLLLLSILACNKNADRAAAADDQILMTDFDGLVEGASWTFRDHLRDGGEQTESDDDDDDDDDDSESSDDGELDEEQLLRARYQGDGEIEFRRGSRWADATSEALLVWDTSDGIALIEWFHPETEGDGNFQLADPYPSDGETNGKNGWSCLTSEISELYTFYGTFENVLEFECSHQQDEGLEGRFVFAENIGLIQLEADDFILDLVAPW